MSVDASTACAVRRRPAPSVARRQVHPSMEWRLQKFGEAQWWRLRSAGGGDIRGDLLGRGQPRPPIAALAGNDSDSLSAAPCPSCDDHSAAFEQEANGNPFVNGMDHKLLNSIPCETRNSVRAARPPSVRLCSLPSFPERLNLSYVLMCSLFL